MNRNATLFDRRAAQRRRVLYAANARLFGSEEAIECAVRSVSDTGAAVALPASAPCAFELTIERDGAIRIAHTVWRRGNVRGVKFMRPSVAEGPRVSIADLRGQVRFTTPA